MTEYLFLLKTNFHALSDETIEDQNNFLDDKQIRDAEFRERFERERNGAKTFARINESLSK